MLYVTSNWSSGLIDIPATGSSGTFSTAVDQECGLMTFWPGCFGVVRCRQLARSRLRVWERTSFEKTTYRRRYSRPILEWCWDIDFQRRWSICACVWIPQSLMTTIKDISWVYTKTCTHLSTYPEHHSVFRLQGLYQSGTRIWKSAHVFDAQ